MHRRRGIESDSCATSVVVLVRRPALARSEVKDRIVGEDGGFPLAEFERQVGFCLGCAGKAPPGAQFLAREEQFLLGGNGNLALDHPDAAAFAPLAAAAREFDAVRKEHVLKRRAPLQFKGFTRA
jgi:hypothetical protein